MKLEKESYTVTRNTLKKVLAALSEHRSECVFDGEYAEEYNNDDVIEAQDALEGEIAQQQPPL